MTADERLEAAVVRVGTMLDTRIGLRWESSIRSRLRRCIREEAALHGEGLDAYLDVLPGQGILFQRLVDRVTVQETGFFRHPEQFAVLERQVLPALQSPVKIWSAGCANGQEAYSLAMLLEEKSLRGSVVATDVSASALSRTSGGVYAAREMTGVSSARRSRHFAPAGDDWRAGKALRSRVTVERHNLLSEPPDQVLGCHIIFCRNVLIYFSPIHAKRLLDWLAEALAPGGVIFFGAAETVWQVTDRLEAVRVDESYMYRPRATADVATSTVSRRPAVVQPSTSSLATIRDSVSTTHPGPPVNRAVSHVPHSTLAADAGRKALAAHDHERAVVAFRRWVYLAPDDPLAALHLGLAFEAGGHLASAGRAFAACRAAVQELGPSTTIAGLDGYSADELLNLLDAKEHPRS